MTLTVQGAGIMDGVLDPADPVTQTGLIRPLNRISASDSVRQPFRSSPDLMPGLLFLIELTSIVCCGLTADYLLNSDRTEFSQGTVFFFFFVALFYHFLSNWANLATLPAIMRPLSSADGVIVSLATSYLFMTSIVYAFKVESDFPLPLLLSSFASGSVAIVSMRFGIFHIANRLARARYIGRNLAVLGAGEQAARIVDRLNEKASHFIHFVGVYTPEIESAPRAVVSPIGSTTDLFKAARSGLIDDVVIAMPWSADRDVIKIVEQLKELPINVFLGSDLVGFDLSFRTEIGSFHQLTVFEVTRRPISGWSSAIKVGLDYIVATTGLILLSPLLAIIALLVKLDTPGPVFFRQERLGFNNKKFYIYKFRSMRDCDSGDEPVIQAARGDARVTRVGRVIRATSLDELPQLFNVLNGTMSLVGPRPHAVSHNEEYGSRIRGYFARHKVKPGITGWAQVKGYRGETRELELMERRVSHDIYYADNWSVIFDIKILIMTCIVVLFQRRAY